MVGTDQATGAERLTFGAIELFDGIDFIVIAKLERTGSEGVKLAPLSRLWPARQDFRDS